MNKFNLEVKSVLGLDGLVVQIDIEDKSCQFKVRDRVKSEEVVQAVNRLFDLLIIPNENRSISADYVKYHHHAS